MRSKTWTVVASEMAMRTENNIRKVVETQDVRPNPSKPVIALSIGDPTVYANLAVCDAVTEALVRKLRTGKYNGYAQSCGDSHARSVLAKRYSCPSAPLVAGDVFLTSGCSQALDICLCVLANAGQNILLPAPSFPLYHTIAQHYGIESRFYRLLPHADWEADLQHIVELIDDQTAAIVLNNPSNPCGSVYSEKHLRDLLKVAEEHHIPIVSDEIYADMVFSGGSFVPLASLSDSVPILTVGGLAKRYLVPGWRLGWILLHDPVGAFSQVREGIVRLMGLILGPNTIVQAALSDIFDLTPADFYQSTMHILHRQAMYFAERIDRIQGLHAVHPQGAMYLMVSIDMSIFNCFKDDREFCLKLLSEESVFVLPGQCFFLPNFFRVVFCAPLDKLKEACDRIEEFCKRHRKPQPCDDIEHLNLEDEEPPILPNRFNPFPPHRTNSGMVYGGQSSGVL
mmetsp:Transcript_19290/g.31574  ORF Transcript_19290/g.31574 Transcript_19290/m.31574 type:complete len:454 (-) Transcript_19290:210-1571(-)